MNAPFIAAPGRSRHGTLEHARVLVRALSAERPAVPPLLEGSTVEFAVTESLGPLVGARVAQGRVVVRQAQREALLREHQLCLAAYLVRDRAALAFVDRCRRAGIPVAWLKGMALVSGILAPGERSMLDADVLVPPARWDEACAIAGELPGAGEVRVPGRDYTTGHDYVRAFSVPPGVTIEVHRYVCEASLFSVDYEGPDGLFMRAAPQSTGIWTLDEGDLFLTLAAHAAKHTFELPLRSYVDGVVLLQRRRFDARALGERAKRWRMDKAFHLWMRVLHALAPFLDQAGAGESVVGQSSLLSGLAGFVWPRTRDSSAWHRFLRLAWLMDRPDRWVGHVLTRVGLRVRDLSAVGGSKGGASDR